MVSVRNPENRPGYGQEDDRDILPEDLLDTDPAIQMPDSSSDDEKLKRLDTKIKEKKASIEAIKKSLADYEQKQLEKKGKDTETPEQIDMRNTIAEQKLMLGSMTDGEEKEKQKNLINLWEQAYNRAFGEDNPNKASESAKREKEGDAYFIKILKQNLETKENELEELKKRYDELDFEIGDTRANA